MRALWVLGAMLVVAAPAAAESNVRWDAPASCPSEDELRHRVEQRIDGSLSAIPQRIDIVVIPAGPSFIASIHVDGTIAANELRTLRAARCDELAEGVALVVARLVGELRERATPMPREQVEAIPVRRPSHDRVGEGAWGAGGRVLGVSGVGALPRVNVGGEVAGYVRRKAAFVELGLARWVPEGATFEAGTPALSLDVATVRAGWRSTEMPLRAWLAGELGTLARADLAQASTRRWTALGAGFGVAWPMADHARLLGTVELAVPLERREITHMMPPSPEPYRPGVAAARCSFGIEVGWQ